MTSIKKKRAINDKNKKRRRYFCCIIIAEEELPQNKEIESAVPEYRIACFKK